MQPSRLATRPSRTLLSMATPNSRETVMSDSAKVFKNSLNGR